jgi:hypothetical protein
MGQHKGDIMSTTTSTMSCRSIVSEELAMVRTRENDPASGHWARPHNKAWATWGSHAEPGMEGAIVRLVEALAAYADAHQVRFESPIGHDAVLGGGKGHGMGWLEILKGTRGLLNGETGRLDCGTVDSMLVRMAQAAGYEEGEL